MTSIEELASVYWCLIDMGGPAIHLHFHHTFMTTSPNGNIVRVTGYRLPVDSPHKGQCRGASMFSLVCAWTNDWAKTRDAGHLRRQRAYYDVTVICNCDICFLSNTLQLWHLLSDLFAIMWYSFWGKWNIFRYYSINYHFRFRQSCAIHVIAIFKITGSMLKSN